MMHKVEDAQKMLMNKAEAKLNRVRSSADTGSSERKRTTEKFTRVIRRTHLRALRRDSSRSDVHECETSVRRSAKMQKDPNISPQASQTPSAKARLARKSRERQPTKRCQKCSKHAREREL